MMARYFTQKPASSFYVEDDYAMPPLPRNVPYIEVSDHEGTDTGFLDVNGNSIMRGPNPIGFHWSQ